jgi:ATP-dependent DNA helicase DinG
VSLVRSVLDRDGLLSEVAPSYEHRPEQIQMAEAVADKLTGGGVLLVEAGTGTGKTLAYLTAAVQAEVRVVISTGTRNLQDQILSHDIPLLERALGREISAVCLKGLGNYLCRRKLDLLERSSPLMDEAAARLLARISSWARESETGDRAELADLPEDLPLWSELSSSSESRLGPKCPFNDTCFVTKARRAAQDAQMVIVNHFLFFADLALRDASAGILPSYDAVIFDEAHGLEAVATRFFGYRVSSRRLSQLVHDTRKALSTLPAAGRRTREREAELLEGIETVTWAFFDTLADEPSRDGVVSARQPLRPGDLDGPSEEAYWKLDNALETLEAYLSGLPTTDESIATCTQRAELIRCDLAEILGTQRSASVYWKELGPRSKAIGASPVEVAVLLRERIFYEVESVVLTSATLTSDGSFDYIKEQLGIDFETSEQILPSPFDFERQVALFVPRDAPDPRREGYLEAVATLIEDTATLVQGGTLALFTSVRDMNRVAELIRPWIERTVRVQGERPRSALLDELRAGDEPILLLATASFWQGVDVPGAALEAVVIARLPFASPADPLVAARLRQLEEQGRSAFMDYQVPQACLTLKQGFGRLIRRRGDRGVVAILDARLRTMGYGGVFLRSLPACTRVGSLEELKRWWEEKG